MNAAIVANNTKEKARKLQRALYLAAKQDAKRRFHALYDKVYRWDVLWEAWKQVRANRGSAGIDGETIKQIEERGVDAFLLEIQEELRSGTYQPKAVRRVNIPKPDGRKRPLGIPTVKDRVVQMATKLVIEPVFEADFLDCSYGFRPKRSAHQAIRAIRNAGKKHSWVVDADIVSFFDNLNHEKLMILVSQRVSDRRVLKLIRKWLKAGVMDGGEFIASDLGSPQGGVISPLLANIYLHYLDTLWEKKCGHLGKLIRYADDHVVLCRTKKEAEQAMKYLTAILKRLELQLHPEKTRLVNLWDGKDGFDFLGLHHRKRKSPGKSVPIMESWPSQKAMKAIREKVREITAPRSKLTEPVQNLIEALNRKIPGWANYYGVGQSFRQFAQLDWYINQRLTLFMNKKHRRRCKSKSREFTPEYFAKLGLLRLYGRTQWQRAHAAG